MSSLGVEMAVEQVRQDHELAQAVVSDGEAALASFDLTAEEASALVEALREDVDRSLGEVSGFAAAPFGSIQLDSFIHVGRQLGAGSPGQVTKDWIDRGLPVKDQGHTGWFEL